MQPVKRNEFEEVYEVILQGSHLKEAFDVRMDQESRVVRRKGFRPGHVPFQFLVTEKGGEVLARILRDKVSEEVNALSEKLGTDRFIRFMYTLPEIHDAVVPEDDMTVTVRALLKPSLPELEALQLSMETWDLKLPDGLIRQVLDKIAARTKISESLPEERVSQMGDVLVVRIKVNGQETGAPTEFILGKDLMMQEFIEDLIGIPKGHRMVQRIKVPKFFPMKNLAGKKVDFELVVEDIRQLGSAVVDDKMAQKVAQCSLEDLEKRLEKEALSFFEGALHQFRRSSLECKLMETLSFEISQDADQTFFHSTKEEFEKLESGAAPESLEEKAQDYALRALRVRFFLHTFFRAQSLKISNALLEGSLRDMAENLNISFDRVRVLFRDNREFYRHVMDNLMQEVAMDAVLERIPAESKVTSEALKSAWDTTSVPCLKAYGEKHDLEKELSFEKVKDAFLDRFEDKKAAADQGE